MKKNGMTLRKKKKEITVETVIKPARYQEVKTGEQREYVVIGTNGKARTERKDITRREFREKEVKVSKKVIDTWEVTDKTGEAHEFMSKQDADNFLRS